MQTESSDDPILERLGRLLDNPFSLRLFGERWEEAGLEPAVGPSGVTTGLVKYVAHSRGTLRHDLQLEHGRSVVIYSKTFDDRTRCESVFANIQALWNSAVRRAGGLMIPRPLFFVRDLNTVFLQGLEGENAHDHLAELDLDEASGRIGSWLAGIHQCPMVGLPSLPDQGLARLDEAEALMSFMSGAAALIRTLRQEHGRLTPLVPTPVHGAFRLSQFLSVDGTFALVDIDGFGLANPIGDVGSFVAHLLYLPLKGELTREHSRSASACFCGGYAAASPWGLPTDVLRWEVAAHLVGKQAKKFLKRGKKDHGKKTAYLLDLAASIVAGEEHLI